MTDISKEALVKNGMDIVDELPFIPIDSLLSSVVGYAHTAFVTFLNDNGHELAGQALDDAWLPREEQWWRQPDGFDGRYKHGQELIDERGY